MPNSDKSFPVRYLLVLTLLFTAIAYYLGLSGSFLFDDYPNIIQNLRLIAIANTPLSIESLQAAISQSQTGPIGRPVSFISFAINLSLTGLDPFYFKLTNLLLHLLNVLAVFFFVKLLLLCYEPENGYRAKLVALLTASAWALHPFHINTVLYVVQRMMGLSTFFVLVALILYLTGRLKLINGQSHASSYFLLIPIPFLLAFFSKENSVLFFAFLLVTEFTLLRFTAKDGVNRKRLKIFFTAVLAIAAPVFLAVMYYLSLPENYAHRDFSLTERVLTQSRILWSYIFSIILPNISQMSVYHDDLVLSSTLFKPISTLFAVSGTFLLGFTAVFYRNRFPIFTFGVAFFFAAHLLESTTVPLELMHEHRNYLASVGPLFIVFFFYIQLVNKAAKPKLLMTLAVLFIAFLGANTYVRSTYWGNDLVLAEHLAARQPYSVRSLMEAGSANLARADFAANPSQTDEYRSKALNYYRRAYELKPSESHALLSAISILIELNRQQESEVLTNKLLNNLRNEKITTETMNAIITTNQCLAQKGCSFPMALFKELAESLLVNPYLKRLNGQQQAQVYSLNSNFAYLDSDLTTAIYLNNKAIAAFAEDAQHLLNHAALLIAAGNTEEALLFLDKAEKVDNSQLTMQNIARQRTTIDSLRNQ